MLSQNCIHELRSAWLPNITDAGLNRLIDLLEKASPLLIHGCFTRAVPMGCLATQVAWNHPRTAHLTSDAGITWLHRVAGLNPATSSVLREWDQCDEHGRHQDHDNVAKSQRSRQVTSWPTLLQIGGGPPVARKRSVGFIYKPRSDRPVLRRPGKLDAISGKSAFPTVYEVSHPARRETVKNC